MAAGDQTIPAGQTKATYVAQNAKLVAEAFDVLLESTSSNSNILGQLVGGPGSNKPFITKQDLKAGRMTTVNMNVASSLGAAGRRGSQVAVNYEEQLIHNNWSVTIDTLRVVVGWNEINRTVANTGKSWPEVYAEMTGVRIGQIEQEDLLMRIRQRSSSTNTIRPGNRATLDTIHYDDTFDVSTFGKGITQLSTRGGKPAMLTNSEQMPVKGYVLLGAAQGIEPLWNDTTFAGALQHADVDGPDASYWTGKLPKWRGCAIKPWDVQDHDNPGAIGSSIIPRALLGDPITSATTVFTMYGSGRTQASLGNQTVIYKPFEYFYGNDKLFGETLSYGTDSGTYYALVIDPADGKWNVYSYVQAGVNSNGASITVTARLHSSTTGAAYTTLKTDGFGGSGTTLWTYDSSVNKVAFPTGSLIIQVNVRIVPICDLLLLAAEAGAYCYGEWKNQRIEEKADYGALVGKGVQSTFGCDLKKDTLGQYRSHIRIQCAYELTGFDLPQI